MSRLIWPEAIVKNLHRRIAKVNIYLRRELSVFFLKKINKWKIQFTRLQKISITTKPHVSGAALILLVCRLN